jgi:hypothetical protein
MGKVALFSVKKYSFVPRQSRRKLPLEIAPVFKPKLKICL